MSFYGACIRRSNIVLLKITLDLESFSSWDDEYVSRINLDHLLMLFVRMTGKHATRWKEFIWKHYGTIFSARYLLRCLPQGIPSLRRLTITQLRWESLEGLHFPNCPNIQTFNLINMLDDSDRGAPILFQQSGFSSLEDLTLSKGCHWQSVDLDYISMFREIHTLTLFSFGRQSDHERVITSSIRVTLPRLRLLQLRGWIPNELLSSIDPPDHLVVVVGTSDGTWGDLHSIETLTGTMVAKKMTIIHLKWPEHAINGTLLNSIFKLLHDAPCLEVVYLSPRAEVMLGHEFEEFKANHNYSFSICTDGCMSLDEHFT